MAEEEAAATLNIACAGREHFRLSALLHATLGTLRAQIAAALAVPCVCLPDYHEGIDDLTLLDAGLLDGALVAVELGDGIADGDAACEAPPPPPPAPPEGADEPDVDGDAAGTGAAAAAPRRLSAEELKALPFATRRAVENASQILDWLYVSGSLAAGSRAALSALGISFVLNCCERTPFASKRTENLLLKLRDIKGETIAPHLLEAYAFLARAKASGQCCLVHCMVGASRSVSVVLAYLVTQEGRSLAEAWTLVKGARKQARPNKGFAEQLIALDAETHGKASMAMADFGY
mmetsp:Transcript_85769/g.275804  ORF Transcript_85769/g.275804 Transcript_85769/m.275804 type:complete len:292 (-) Transcript_85769:929-1804(-)